MKTIRLQGYDYSRAGAYFLTICVQNRQCLFGEILDGEMRLNDAGRMVERWYCELEKKYPEIQCDKFVCMPNHVHFIVVNVGADLRVRPDSTPRRTMAPHRTMGEHAGSMGGHTGSMGGHTGPPLRRVMQWFKTMTTNEYIRGVKKNGWRPFPGKLWQRNYWEHIIRNESELNRIREYIRNNPIQWDLDKLHPNVGANLCVRPDSGVRHDDGKSGQTCQGQTHRSAPTEIRETSAIYGQSAGRPNDEGWMV